MGMSQGEEQNQQQRQQQAKKKLKTFGKNRRELKVNTVYDEAGNWAAPNHQELLRQLKCPALEAYYCGLQKVCTAVEWEAEMNLFRQPLPTTIWINDTDSLAKNVSRYFESLDRSLVEPIPWYPLIGMGWRILAGKTEFRKRPEMQALRRFLIQQTALGTISRQEEVSMLPPFLLDIQPNDICLDMCASPGSKTAQMLVALGRHKLVPATSDVSPFPFDYESKGLVIANDIDTKRASMLVHQVKRLRLLFPFALFTSHDARYFPNVSLELSSQSSITVPPSLSSGDCNEELRFDKILCDVVCSGDGTIRKAPHIFKIWSPREAITLQKTQIQIALRGCHLLRVGGRLVYSTCSMNPIENEAVVAQIVHRTGGAVKLVDARSLLPGLNCAPGLQWWVVTNTKGVVVNAPCDGAHEALFPPNTPGAYTSNAVNELDLRLCMRVFPTHCKGGAFFIAVFDKIGEFRLRKRDGCGVEQNDSSNLSVNDNNNSNNNNNNNNIVSDSFTGEGMRVERENEKLLDDTTTTTTGKRIPPKYIVAPTPITDALESWYKVKDFPIQQLVVRAPTGHRELNSSLNTPCSIVSRSAMEVLQAKTDALIVVSAGLRVFAHENLDGGWRIASESSILFAKLMQNSPCLLRVHVSLIELLLMGGKLKGIPFTDIEDESLRTRLESMGVGTVLLEVDAPNAVGGLYYTVALRARKRLQLLVDHEDLVGLRLRLGIAVHSEEEEPISAV